MQIAAKSINPSNAMQRVEKSVASNVSETPSAQVKKLDIHYAHDDIGI